MSVSGANMLLQTTFVVVVFCVLVGNSSTCRVFPFLEVKSNNGDVLCGTSPPNKTQSAVEKRIDCLSLCNKGCRSPCQAINYRQTAQLCDMFYYEPCSYDLQPDCANYKVMPTIPGLSIKFYCTVSQNTTFWLAIGLLSQNQS